MSSPMQLVGGGVMFAGFIVWEQWVGIGCADQDTRYPSALLEEVGVQTQTKQSPGCQVPPCTACLSNAQSLSFLENMTTFLWPEMF